MYDWMRALHIIAVIAWMAGLLMYPRLLVYRLEGQGNPGLEGAMDAAARRLQTIILNPAMVLAWLLGIGLASSNYGYYAGQPWFWIKLALVVALSGVHGFLLSAGKKIAAGGRPLTSKKLRLLNELPMVVAVVAVVMVVVQPFAR
ncbi:MAG: CopD family protein [Alphaproteobacteria bacterium]|nr:CopD family protein [Alphaproteobacteria bacterium]